MQKEKDTHDYFLASRNAGWWLIGSSIFASNIGAEHLIGLAGSGAKTGMAFAHWELHSYIVIDPGLGVRAVLPAVARSSRRRSSSRSATRPRLARSLSLIFLVSYVLTKASVTIFAGAFAIQTILGYDTIDVPLVGKLDFFWFSAFALVIITGVYTDRRRHEVGALDGRHARAGAAWSVRSCILLRGSLQIGGLDPLLAANADTISLWRPLQQAAGDDWLPPI